MLDEATPDTPAVQELGHAGWFALLAAGTFLVIRLLKTNTLDAALAKLGIPSIPKKALPWLALILPGIAAFIEAKRTGMGWEASAIAGLWGVFSGSLSIGVNETLPTPTKAISEPVSKAVFGADAGPNPGPAADTPSHRPPPNPPTGPTSGGSSSGGAMHGVVMAFGSVMLSAALLFGATGCASIVKALVNAASYIDEAQLILDQIQAFVDAFFLAKPDAAKQETINKAIAKSRAALGTALKGTRGAEKLDQAQIDAAFAEFASAYRELLTLVGPLGVRTTSAFAVSPDGALTVPPVEQLVPKAEQ